MAFGGVSLRAAQIQVLRGWGRGGHFNRASLHPTRRASSLGEKSCKPCEGSTEIVALDKARAEEMLEEVDGWTLREDENKQLRIQRQFVSKNFLKALELFNRIAVVAEEEGHHPDLHLEGWNRASIELWTHSKNGLTENDFIMAAKINGVPKDDLLRKKKAKPGEG